MLKTYLLISILLLWCFVGIYSYIYVCKFLPYCFALPPHSCYYSPQCNYQVGMLLIILLLLWVSLPTHLLLIFLSLMSLHLTPPAFPYLLMSGHCPQCFNSPSAHLTLIHTCAVKCSVLVLLITLFLPLHKCIV